MISTPRSLTPWRRTSTVPRSSISVASRLRKAPRPASSPPVLGLETLRCGHDALLIGHGRDLDLNFAQAISPDAPYRRSTRPAEQVGLNARRPQTRVEELGVNSLSVWLEQDDPLCKRDSW